MNPSFQHWSKKMTPFSKCLTQRINWSFLENVNSRIELFWKKKKGSNKLHSSMWLKEFDLLYTTKRMKLFSVWRKELSPFFIMTRRIEHPFWICLNELNPFVDDSKTFSKKKKDFQELNLSKNVTQRIELFWVWFKELNLSFLNRHRIKDDCFQYDSKHSILLFQFDSKNWIWLKALNPLFQYESTNRTLFSTMTQRIELFLNMNHRNFSEL